MTTATSTSTKDKILDTAERLFADQGFAGTSLRSITAGAGVNLAAVHYHFGSKEELIRAVFSRRLTPLNRERLRLLEECSSGTGDPDLECIIEAFVAPPIRVHSHDVPSLPRLIGRGFSDTDGHVQDILKPQFAEIRQAFLAALRKALPDLSEEELHWRMLFLIGAMAFPMLADLELPRPFDRTSTRDPEGIIRELVAFVAAGMRAEARDTRSGGGR